jgi:hypothetical protein
MMKKLLLPLICICVSIVTYSQDINILLKEADNFEKQQKEADALGKYKQVLLSDPNKLKALVKSAELNALLGNKELRDKNSRRLFYETALSYANRAYQADSTSADACYAMAMASGKMTDVETENKKMVGYVRDIKFYADKALAINPNHARANYVLGKWNYELANLSGIKKAAVKILYGGLPEGSLEKAIQYMEKCKSLEPYFVKNYLELAKAYKDNHQPAQAIDILNKLVKLPTRTSEDIPLKEEGAKLLDAMQ